MSLSTDDLHQGGYQEHLTEAGFLLTYRQSYFADASISWLDVEEREERIAAHVDGIELGGELAYQCALEFLAGGDEDQTLGAIYALSSINDKGQALTTVVDAFTKAPDDQLALYVEAFKHAQHPLLSEKLLALLDHERLIIRAACTEILGYCREGDPKRLWPSLRSADAMVQGTAMYAAVRYGFKEALETLEQIALDGKDTAEDSELLALLCLGSKRALDQCRTQCGSENNVTPSALLYLALAGNERDMPVFLQARSFAGQTAPVCRALGYFGVASAVSMLLVALQDADDDAKSSAAHALQRITAAGLKETATLADEEEPDLTPGDITGEKVPPDSEPKTTAPPRTREVEQICTDPARWAAWWQQNAARFNSSPRWRNGKPFDCGVLVDILLDARSDYETRQLAHLELIIRSGQHIPFEPDGFISKQQRAISQWQAWWHANVAVFKNRCWTYDGQ
jgi:uncharacterized protein (TIGR02270 family)